MYHSHFKLKVQDTLSSHVCQHIFYITSTFHPKVNGIGIMGQQVHSKYEPHNRHRCHTVPTLSYTLVHQVLLEHWLCVAILTEVWRGLIKTEDECTEAKAPQKKVQCPTAEEGCSRNKNKKTFEQFNWQLWNDSTDYLFEILTSPSPVGQGMEDQMLLGCGWNDRELMKMLRLRNLRGNNASYPTDIMNSHKYERNRPASIKKLNW